MVKQEEGRGCGVVIGVELEDGVEAAAVLLAVVCLGGQPEPGADHQGARTVEALDSEPGGGGSKIVKGQA